MPHNSDRTLLQFLLTIAFVIVVGIFNWIRKRSEAGQPSDTSSERPVPPPFQPRRQTTRPVLSSPAPRKMNWEEELRRMLEGEQPAPPPLPEQPAAPAPPPLIHTARPALMRPVIIEQERGLPVQMPGLTASAQSYERASQLDENVAEHLRDIGAQVRRHSLKPRPGMVSQEVAHTVALLRSPHSLRT